MKKVLIVAALLTLTASVAAAQGISLSWNQCYQQNQTLINRNGVCYTCAAAVPQQRIIASFISPTTVDIVSATSIIDVDFPGPQPAWWMWNATDCRPNGGRTAPTYGGTATLCPDFMGGSGLQGNILVPFNGWKGPNTLRLVIENSRDGVFNVLAGSHYVAQQLDLNNTGESVDCNASPTPDPSQKCAGCATAATLALNEVKVTPAPGAGPAFLVTAVNGRNYVHWNNGVGVPTPTQNKSWGAVKALYR